jgi:hypothetical protein
MKVNRKNLTQLITEMLSEDSACDAEIVQQNEHTPEVVVQNILNYITMAKCAQKDRETSFNFEEFSGYIEELRSFDENLKAHAFFGYRTVSEENAHYEMERQMRGKFKALYTLKKSKGDHHREEMSNLGFKKVYAHIKLEWDLNKDVAYYIKMAEKIIFQIQPKTQSQPSYSMDMMVESPKEKLNRNYLYNIIKEVLQENEEEDDVNIEKRIKDFINSNDLESFNTGLSLLDTFEMSGLIEPRKAKDLKMLMYKSAKENDLFLDDVAATYNFIMSDEFASSFSDEEMANVRSTVFDILSDTSLESFEKLIEWVIADPTVSFNRYSGSFDLYMIEDIPNQEFVDRIIGKFKELSGQKDFAVFSMADGPEIYIGEEASRLVNFNPSAEEVFGFKPKGLPNFNYFVGAFTSEIGYGMPFEMENSPMFGGKNVDYHFKISNEMSNRWRLTIIFNDGFAGNMEIVYRDRNASYVITLSSHHKDYTSGDGRTAWVTEDPSYESYTNYNREGMINKVKEMTGIDLTNVEKMDESLLETEENFGRESRGEVLVEAWDSQWPSEFSELKTSIQDFTDKGKAASDILAKYALEAMTFNHLGPTTIWNAYGRLFKAFVRTYVRDENDLRKIRKFITNRLSPDFKAFLVDQFRDARRDKGNEGALRVLNTHVKGLDKQIRRIWRSLDDTGVDWKNVEEEYDREITQTVQIQQFKEVSLITSRILEIINFVNMDKSDDNAKKLAAFYKKIKQAANSPEIDVSAIVSEVEIVQLSLDFVEDQLINIDMTLCPDAEVGAPCVMHNFDDGFFWYDISADTCELTARKMNSCGDASMSGSELFNLMSHSETGKPRWHVTVEWNEEEKAFIQVLGNANTVPKQEYWPYIKWLYEKYGKPEISNYAWEHVQGDNVKPRVYAFLQYLGLKSREPLSETWEQMKQQVSDGFYNVFSWGEGERPVEDDWSKLSWIPHSDRVAMAMRIKRRLISTKSIETGRFEYEDVRDYKAAARKLENEGTVESLVFQDLMPSEWNEFFSSEGITQRVRFSHGGNMILYFNWTSKKLQDPSDGNYRDDEYMKELQRQALARFMNDAKQNFSVEAMTKVGKLIGDQLEKDADDWAMKRAAYNRGDDLDEGKKKMKLDRNYLTKMILEVLNESSEEEREFDFSGMISKDLDFEGLRGIIELLLDSEDVKYETVVRDDKIYYIFHEQPYEDYYWYMPFQELVDALEKAGIPNQNKMRLKTKIKTPTFQPRSFVLDRRTIVIYDNSK